MDQNVLIIGPSPSRKVAGVVTHIRNLLTYKAFKNSEVIDIGSLNGVTKNKIKLIFNVINKIVYLRTKINNKSVLIINASIHKKSIYKLIIILSIIGKKTNKVLVFFHGGRFGKERKINLLILKKIVKYRCIVKCFYFLSDIQEKEFKNHFKNIKTEVYNNYSSTNNILKKEKNRSEFKYLFVGRLAKEKGIIEAIKATKDLVSQTKKKFIFEIVGDGEIKDMLIKMVENMELENIVKFKGHLSGEELKKAYQSADWFIFPTYYPEGFPYVYIESMQAGVPLISTKSGALSRLVEDGINGFIIKERDVQDLTKKMMYVIENKPQLNSNCYNIFKTELSKNRAEKYYEKILKKI